MHKTKAIEVSEKILFKSTAVIQNTRLIKKATFTYTHTQEVNIFI